MSRKFPVSVADGKQRTSKDFELQERKIVLQMEQQRNEGRITVLHNFQASVALTKTIMENNLSCKRRKIVLQIEQQKMKTCVM